MSEGGPSPQGHHHQYEVKIPSPIPRRRRSALYIEELGAQFRESTNIQGASQNIPEPLSPQLASIKAILSLQKHLSTSSLTSAAVSSMADTPTDQNVATAPINTNASTTLSSPTISMSLTAPNNLPKPDNTDVQVAAEAIPLTESSVCKLQEFICCRNSNALSVQQPMPANHPAAKLLCHLRANEDFPAGIRYVKEFKFDTIVCITMPSKLKWRCFAWIENEASTEDKAEQSGDSKCDGEGGSGENGKGKQMEEELVEVDPDTWKYPMYAQMHGFIQYACKQHNVGVVLRAHRQDLPKLFGEAQRRAKANRRMKIGLDLVGEIMDENSETSQEP